LTSPLASMKRRPRPVDDRHMTLSRRTAAVAILGAFLCVGTTATSAAAMTVTAATSGSAVRLPPANGRFDYQIGGAYKPARSVDIVDRDRGSHPAPGVYNVCYINAFQTQAESDRWWRARHPNLLLRNATGMPSRILAGPGSSCSTLVRRTSAPPSLGSSAAG
jgi:hypothetical protein